MKKQHVSDQQVTLTKRFEEKRKSHATEQEIIVVPNRGLDTVRVVDPQLQSPLNTTELSTKLQTQDGTYRAPNGPEATLLGDELKKELQKIPGSSEANFT